MGTCGSKCCFETPTLSPSISISDPGSPRDKAVISSDPHPFNMPPPPKDPISESSKFHSKFQIHPYPAIPSSSSSCMTPASSAISTSTSCTTTISSYSSSSYSTTNSTEISSESQTMDSYSTCRPIKKKSFSNEFLWSCVENSNIVILDPTKGIKQKPVESEISEISSTPSKYPSAASSTTTRGITTSSLRQRTNSVATMRNNQSNNAKRARSISPASRTGRKVIKPDPGLWNPVSSNITSPRTGDLQPPQWRPINSQRETLNSLTGPVSRADSAVKRDWQRPTMEKEAKQRRIQDGDVISRERVNTPPPLVEDLNNPLIAMDCFIFL